MRLVIDANILLAGLLRQSTTRTLIFDPRLELFAPENLPREIESHLLASTRFRKRLGISAEQLSLLLSLLFSTISVVPKEHYSHAFQKALEIAPHNEDAAYLAVAIAMDIPIWSNDRGMRKQSLVGILTTIEMLEKMRKGLLSP